MEPRGAHSRRPKGGNMKYNEILEKMRLAVQSLQTKKYKERIGNALHSADSVGVKPGEELEPSHASHRELVSANDSSDPAPDSEDAIRDDMSEYFDGKLSKEKARKLFAPRSERPIPAKKQYAAANRRSGETVKLDPDDPEFGSLHGHRYFKDEAEQREREDAKRNRAKGIRIFWKAWSIIRVPIILGVSVFVVWTLLSKVWNRLNQKYLMPVDENDATPIIVTIEPGSGASKIAKVLYEACGEGEQGLISNKAVFKVYVDFIGKSSRLQAGTYVLSKNMKIPEIVDTLCRGVPPREVIKIQIAEGMTVEGIAAKLVADGVLASPDRFLELCKTGKAFEKDHAFIKDIPDDETGERQYRLEGFLFPATYEVFVDANEETIIDKMLSRFDQIWGPIYTARAKTIGLSMYEVVTLASTIEKEARIKDDFGKVSAVFNNRMALGMMLESDATIEYVLKTGSLHLSAEQLATPSGYNTHINQGLPIGPVSNPGDAALNAALFPNEQFKQDGYLYFCLTDPNVGALVYAKTPEEHAENVAKYSPLW